MSNEFERVFNVRPDLPNASSDFWQFKAMVTPLLIRIVFWFALAASLANGIILLVEANNELQLAIGLVWLLVGPLVVRIVCELWILFFRINETLTEISHKLDHRREGQRDG